MLTQFSNQPFIYTPTTAYATYRHGTSPHQEYLLKFTSEYGISKALHPELPRPEDRIVDFPEGKDAGREYVFPKGCENTGHTPYPNQETTRGATLLSGVKPQILPRRRDIDLFNLIRAPNPTKVKTGSRPRAAHEVPLLTVTANRVIEMEDSTAATDSSGNCGPGGAAPEDVPTMRGAPEAGPAERATTTDPPAAKECRKRGNDGVDTNAPPKLLRRDHADPRPTKSTRRGKSLAAIEMGMGSTRSIHKVCPQTSSKGVAAVGDPESKNTSFASMAGSPEGIYWSKWGITNGSMLDTPKACQDLGDHVAPPGYFLELRHMRNDDFLKQYNVNLARQVVMGSQLRLRFEQEAKLLKKSVAQVARRDKRIQARENEIKNLETLLEAKADMKKAVEDKSAELSQELENMRALFSDPQRCAEIDARLDELSIDFDEELYPHMLTAIAGHWWMIGRGMRLAVMKCEHGQANLDLEAIEAYDPEAEGKYIAALQALKNLKYPLVDQLEGLKDAPMDVIMASLHLESDTGDDAPQWVRKLRPSSSQLMIPVYPKVRDPMDPWACKEEMLLANAIAANVNRAEKKKKCRVICRTHKVGSAHHARSDGVLVSVLTVVPQGLAILLGDAATQTETSDEASP
uniref:Transposase (Putative), gypsy type n=1 Tax=Tanacetum cinerariifolium TaxID=118510 RepID=A0A699HI30_TANCI|nr:hypothetical protein [Tanacetum cinerariifolium]